MNENKLNDKELEMLNNFKKTKARTEEEIIQFVKILIAVREQPDKNPQLKGR